MSLGIWAIAYGINNIDDENNGTGTAEQQWCYNSYTGTYYWGYCNNWWNANTGYISLGTTVIIMEIIGQVLYYVYLPDAMRVAQYFDDQLDNRWT